MEVESSDKRNLATTMKTDSQSNSLAAVLKASSGKGDKGEVLEINRNKTISKTNASSNDGSGQRSPTNSPERMSTTINRIPKPEFPFREATSSAISDMNNQTSDIAESISATEVEIKEEDISDSPGAPLPLHAISKIQVSFVVTLK